MLPEISLYLLPVVARVVLTPPTSLVLVGRLVLSLIPLAVVFPTLWFPRWFEEDEVREHVRRHAAYAFAFTVSIACCPHWPTVVDALNEGREWARALVAYSALGCVTLWWFVVSHAQEDHWPLRTHQGDVSVLPLTLVAIASFALDVPDNAFQYTRTTFFFVPVVVACATFHFLAYHGFALTRTTTYSEPTFAILARVANVMSCSILTLLEVRASPTAFQFLPLAVALVSQAVKAPRTSVPLYAHREGSVALVGFAFGALTFGILQAIARSAPLLWLVGAYGVVVQALTLPPLVGLSWPLVGAPLSTLITVVFWDAATTSSPLWLPLWSLSVGLAYVLATILTELVSPSVRPSGMLPPPLGRRPLAAHPRTPSSLPSLPADGAYEDTAHLWSQLPSLHWTSGVWWLCDAPTVHQDLLWVHEGNVLGGAFPPTRQGRFRRRFAAWCEYRFAGPLLNEGWIATETCIRVAGVLRIGRKSGWIHVRDADHLERIVYDWRGRQTLHYTLLRVCLSNGAKTRHHASFLRTHRSRLFLKYTR